MLQSSTTPGAVPVTIPTLTAADRWTYERQANRLQEQESALRAGFERGIRFYQALLGEHLPTNPNELILDLPCGEGQMLHNLQRLGYRQLEGFDLDGSRVAVGRRLGLPVAEGDVFEVLAGRPDDSIPCILSMDFVEHIGKDDVVRYLELARRKLKPWGRLILRTPCADSPFGSRHIHNDFTHKWAATSGVLRGLLKGAGFSNAAVFGEHPRLAMRGGLLRVPAFAVASFCGNLFTRALNIGPISIWSSSMWGVGIKS